MNGKDERLSKGELQGSPTFIEKNPDERGL